MKRKMEEVIEDYLENSQMRMLTNKNRKIINKSKHQQQSNKKVSLK
jgi:hypothetical protein